MTKELTAQDNLDSIANPMDDALKGKGITAEYLAQKLKAELNAKETKVFHNKDVVLSLEECPNCKGEKGNKKCKACKGKGYYEISPVVFSKPMIAWDVRQKARQDAHKLGGHYPSEKQEFELGKETVRFIMDLKEND